MVEHQQDQSKRTNERGNERRAEDQPNTGRREGRDSTMGSNKEDVSSSDVAQATVEGLGGQGEESDKE